MAEEIVYLYRNDGAGRHTLKSHMGAMMIAWDVAQNVVQDRFPPAFMYLCICAVDSKWEYVANDCAQYCLGYTQATTHPHSLDIVPAFPSIAPENVFPDRFPMTGGFLRGLSTVCNKDDFKGKRFGLLFFFFHTGEQ